MLDMFKEKMLTSNNAAVGVTGAMLSCCSLVPPALLFGCRYLTQDCQRTIAPPYQEEVDAGKRLKME